MSFRLPDEPASPLRWAQLLDRASAEANDPLETTQLDGWVLRYSPLGFNRLSSAWPRAAGSGDLEARLAQVERFYSERDQVARMVVSPASQPVGLSASLATSGWNLVTTADVLSRRLGSTSPVSAPPHGLRVDVSEIASAGFLGAWVRSDSRVAAAPEEAQRLVAPSEGKPTQRFVSVLDAQDACVGIARLAIGFGNAGLGVFGVWVEPAFRGRGLATAMCATAESLADHLGAPRTWLQVERDNAKAQRLYRALGYADCYSYDCWVK